MKFYFNVRGDRLRAYENYGFVEGNRSVYEAVFQFDEEWQDENGEDRFARMCIVYNNGIKALPIQIKKNEKGVWTCKLPLLKNGSAKVGVVGIDGEEDSICPRISTSWANINVGKGAANDDVAEDIDKTVAEIWEQHFVKMTEDADKAADAKTAAENSAYRAKKYADSIENLQVSASSGKSAGVKKTETVDGIKLSFTLPKGDTGSQGEQGIQGPKGEDGYTPIKGVDYFTPEDIESLNIPDKDMVTDNDTALKSLQYYGDANIVPSDSELFNFEIISETLREVSLTVNKDGVAELSGGVVIPHSCEIDGKTYYVTTLGKHTFANFTEIDNIIIPNTVQRTGDSSFFNISIGNINLPDSIIELAGYAFTGCQNLKNVKLPGNLEVIEAGTFQNCPKLNNIIIPKSVKTIKSKSFIYCDSLTDIYFEGTKAEWDKIVIEENNDSLQGAVIHYEWSEDITIDSELNPDSENPVQNKVVTAKFNEVDEKAQLALGDAAVAIEDAGIAIRLAERNRDIIETELKPNIDKALVEISDIVNVQIPFIYDEISSHTLLLSELSTRTTQLETDIGDIDTALESIIEIQNSLIGGDTE